MPGPSLDPAGSRKSPLVEFSQQVDMGIFGAWDDKNVLYIQKKIFWLCFPCGGSGRGR